jgi:hypothetical protein
VGVSRRRFLKTGTMVSLSAAVTMNSVVSAFARQSGGPDREGLFNVPDGNDADGRLTEEVFSRYVNTQFLIYTSPLTAINLELVKVKRWETKAARAASEVGVKSPELDCFSVLFRGPLRIALESKIYKITHDQMGTFDLFISPVNESKKERLYQAVFNRLRS